jgi:hypothetical protein
LKNSHRFQSISSRSPSIIKSRSILDNGYAGYVKLSVSIDSMSLPNMTPKHSPAVYKLEREIALLPVEDKLQLRDGIDLQIRAAALGKSVSEIEAQLEEMANDPDIQRELAAIELEFAATSMDGLEG